MAFPTLQLKVKTIGIQGPPGSGGPLPISDPFIAPITDVSLDGFKIVDLGAPVDPTDATNKEYVDAAIASAAPIATTSSLGMIRIGTGLSIDVDGITTVDGVGLVSTPTNGDIITTNAQGQPIDSGLHFADGGEVSTATSTLAIPTVSQVSTMIANLGTNVKYQGEWDASVDTYPTIATNPVGAIYSGFIWRISAPGILGGVPVIADEILIAVASLPGQTATNWVVVEKNLGYTPVNSAGDTMTGLLILSGDAVGVLGAVTLQQLNAAISSVVDDSQSAYVPLSSVGVADGVCELDSSGLVPAARLPSYVDDVLNYPTENDFPAIGESSKIYIADDTNSQYRWASTAYIQITASPGTTDAVPEGVVNLYFDSGRVRNTILTGISFLTSSDVTAADSVLVGFGKLQAQLANKAPTNSPSLTGVPTAPTATAGTNTTQIASTAFVTTATSAITKTSLGLGNVDNTSDTNKPVSTTQQTALDLKAPLASPSLTGVPTVPTATTGTNTTQIASTAFVTAATSAARVVVPNGEVVAGNGTDIAGIPKLTYLGGTLTLLDGVLEFQSPTGTTGSSIFGTTGSYPNGVDIHESSGTVYTINRDSNTVTKITSSGTSSTFGSTGAYPYGIVVNQSTGDVYTANLNSNNITKITSAGVVSTFASTGAKPARIAMKQSSGEMYTPNNDSNNVSRITSAGVSTIMASVGANPQSVTVNQVTGDVYVGCNGSLNVYKITSAGTATILGASGGSPNAIVVNESTGDVYVANGSLSHTITKITSAGVSSVFYTFPQNVGRLAIDQATGNIYATTISDTLVTKITPAGVGTQFGTTGSASYSIVFDTSTGNVYAANVGTNNVTKITSGVAIIPIPTTGRIKAYLDNITKHIKTIDDVGTIRSVAFTSDFPAGLSLGGNTALSVTADALEVNGTFAFGLPPMSTAQRVALVPGSRALEVYDTTINRKMRYNPNTATWDASTTDTKATAALAPYRTINANESITDADQGKIIEVMGARTLTVASFTSAFQSCLVRQMDASVSTFVGTFIASDGSTNSVTTASSQYATYMVERTNTGITFIQLGA